jgi:hypothetical protein
VKIRIRGFITDGYGLALTTEAAERALDALMGALVDAGFEDPAVHASINWAVFDISWGGASPADVRSQNLP